MDGLHDLPELPRWDGRIRGPVTEREALIAHQRSFAEGLSRRRVTDGAGAPIRWPDRAPSSDDKRQLAAYRIDAQALAYARARASIEGLTMSQVLDRLLRQYAAHPPGTWPLGWMEPDEDTELDPNLPGRGA